MHFEAQGKYFPSNRHGNKSLEKEVWGMLEVAGNVEKKKVQQP